MKVVFLDIDGVLNSLAWLEKRPPGEPEFRLSAWSLDPAAVAVLDRIVRASGAVVVVSSSWRILRSARYIGRVLRARGFTGSVIDATPRLDRGEDGVRKYRGDEIQLWMDRSPEKVEAFVILDDDSDMVHLCHKLVQTSNDVGLTDEHVGPALAHLGVQA